MWCVSVFAMAALCVCVHAHINSGSVGSDSLCMCVHRDGGAGIVAARLHSDGLCVCVCPRFGQGVCVCAYVCPVLSSNLRDQNHFCANGR